MIGIIKKDVVKPILIKVTFEKDFKEYRKNMIIGCYFKVLGYFCIKMFGILLVFES